MWHLQLSMYCTCPFGSMFRPLIYKMHSPEHTNLLAFLTLNWKAVLYWIVFPGGTSYLWTDSVLVKISMCSQESYIWSNRHHTVSQENTNLHSHSGSTLRYPNVQSVMSAERCSFILNRAMLKITTRCVSCCVRSVCRCCRRSLRSTRRTKAAFRGSSPGCCQKPRS